MLSIIRITNILMLFIIIIVIIILRLFLSQTMSFTFSFLLLMWEVEGGGEWVPPRYLVTTRG